MKIGIIVYSETGNTIRVCENLKTGLEEAGRSVTVERIEITGNPHGDTSGLKITNAPDTKNYEAVIFASPVQGFSLARPMRIYMKTLGGLDGKKTAFLVTKKLPFKWTGGNQALAEMQKLAREAGAGAESDSIVIWPDRKAQEDILSAVDQLKRVFIATEKP